MDFLNPKKRRANKIRLYIGYGLMVILLLLATTVLLYQAYGYGLGHNGQIYQNGLLYLSSAPSGAKISLNGQAPKTATNARLELPAGQYTVKLTLPGYRSWQRAIGLGGSSVEQFNYPFLFPKQLLPEVLQRYAAKPGVITQSPDQRWLLVEQSGSLTNFTEYDLNNSANLAGNTARLDLPPAVLTASASPKQTMQAIGWSSDNNYLLMKHAYGASHEYVLFDRANPSDSLNLTTQLQLSQDSQLSLDNQKYNEYYVFNAKTSDLDTASLDAPTLAPLISHVINFKAYGSDMVLYATALNAPAKQVNINLLDAGQNYTITSEPASTTYALNMTQYNGDLFVAAGAVIEGRVYIYKNPVNNLVAQPKQLLVPDYILKLNQPQTVDFSKNAQFVDAENGSDFAVFDLKSQKAYSYKLSAAIASGHGAQWMDGYRLMAVSGGHLLVWDYDDANQQTLQPALASSVYFGPSYKYVYNLTPGRHGQSVDLTQTSLLATSK
ncbi:MAG: PEGA domain-containing protein [Candidatus Saccharimonadales bacterium]